VLGRQVAQTLDRANTGDRVVVEAGLDPLLQRLGRVDHVHCEEHSAAAVGRLGEERVVADRVAWGLEQPEVAGQLQIARHGLELDPFPVPGLVGVAEAFERLAVPCFDELLLVQHGREQGYSLSDEQFKNVVDQVKKDNKLDDAQFKAALTQEGMTLDSYRQMMERQMIVGAVQRQEIMQKATLTDEEARQYYDKHPEDFMKPSTVTLREMLFIVPTETRDGQQVFSAGADDAAKKKADDARARLLKGDDFATVATEMSDSASKANGGLIGVVNLDQMNPDLRAVIDKLKPGESSEPVRVKAGYQIFKVDSRTPAEVEAFDKVRDKISQKVYSERLDGETQKFLTKLRETALIEWKDDTYKQMYEKAIAAHAGK